MNKARINKIDAEYRCKCCLERGDLKSMWNKYKWNGEQEIYGEMLSDCFSLNWQPEIPSVEQICQLCVQRLRDAVNFKRTILCSEKFLAEQLERASKNDIKEEKVESEGEIDTEYLDVDYHVEESYEDVEEPQKQSDKELFVTVKAEPLKLCDNDELKSSKHDRKYSEEDFKECLEAVKSKTMSQSKASVLYKVPVRTIRKALHNISDESGRRVPKPRQDMLKQQENIDCLLKNTNATPIRGYFGKGYTCYYCPTKFEQPKNLKEHTLTHHNGDNFQRLIVVRDHNIKMDITDFKCIICDESVDTLAQMWTHLSKKHDKIIHSDLTNQLVLFRLDNENVLKCVECFEEYKSFKLLNDHMNSKHYKNYECEKCGRGFISKKTFRAHGYTHETGETYPCQYCSKIYPTKIRRREHEKWVHLCPDKRHKCGYCDEKFTDMVRKNNHEVEIHNAEVQLFECQACNKTFKSQRSLRVHLKGYHLMSRPYKCSECELSFFQKIGLDKHMVRHTGAREFVCNVCSKRYGRKSTLREHMRIHEDDRRFRCKHCSIAFVQKCSWKSHLRSAHGENI